MDVEWDDGAGPEVWSASILFPIVSVPERVPAGAAAGAAAEAPGAASYKYRVVFDGGLGNEWYDVPPDKVSPQSKEIKQIPINSDTLKTYGDYCNINYEDGKYSESKIIERNRRNDETMQQFQLRQKREEKGICENLYYYLYERKATTSYRNTDKQYGSGKIYRLWRLAM